MRRIRIKKAVSCVLAVTINGKAENLTGRALSLILIDPKSRRTQLPFEIVSGNKLSFRVEPDLQSFTGIYNLEVWLNKGQSDQSVVDRRSAFELVPITGEESDGTPDDIAWATADLGTASLAVGIRGLQGEPGPAGSDAEVTEDNIVAALGYTPADNADLEDFQTELAGCVKSDGTGTLSISRTNSVISMGNGFNILTSGSSRLDLLRDENSASLQGGVVRLTSTTPTGVIKKELQLSNDSLLLRERTTGQWVNKTVATTDQIPTDYVKKGANGEDLTIRTTGGIHLVGGDATLDLDIDDGILINGQSLSDELAAKADYADLEDIDLRRLQQWTAAEEAIARNNIHAASTSQLAECVKNTGEGENIKIESDDDLTMTASGSMLLSCSNDFNVRTSSAIDFRATDGMTINKKPIATTDQIPDVSGKADKTYVDTQLASKASTSSVSEISSEITTLSGAAVKVTEQTLTDSQKAQARANIGAAAEGSCGGSAEWKCVFDGEVAVGEVEKTFTTFADGTAISCNEVEIQILMKEPGTTTKQSYLIAYEGDKSFRCGALVNEYASATASNNFLSVGKIYAFKGMFAYTEYNSSAIKSSIATFSQSNFGIGASPAPIVINNAIDKLKFFASNVVSVPFKMKIYAR